MTKKILTFAFIVLLLNLSSNAQNVVVTTDQAAEFFFNGQSQGNRSEVSFKLNKKRPTIVVSIKKNGFVPVERKYSRIYGKPPKSDHIKLEQDEAYNNSVEGDFANKNINITTEMSYDDAWKYLAIICRTHFEVLEKSDKETGFMQSAWYLKKFNYYTVRQRFTVAQMTITPLSFNIKIQSEITANKKNDKDSENYEKWDRVLKEQAEMFSELQLRLRKK